MRAAERIEPQVDGSPGETVRYIRRALGLSQREFARALGWSPATISRWETGRARPTRLGMKIVLAFAAERGVWPPPPRRAQLPALRPPVHKAPVVLVSRMLPPEVGPPPPQGGVEPAWGARVSLQMEIRAPRRQRPAVRPETGRTRVAGRRRVVAMLAAAAALAVGIAALVALVAAGPTARSAAPGKASTRAVPPAGARDGNGGSGSPAGTAAGSEATPGRESSRGPAAARPAGVAASGAGAREDPASLAEEGGSGREGAAPPLESPAAAAVLPAHRVLLLGVAAVGASRWATFRLDGEVLRVGEGMEIGGRRVARIGPDGVELEDAEDEGRSLVLVRVGETLAW